MVNKVKPIILSGENFTHAGHPLDRTSGDCDVTFRVPKEFTYFIKKIEVHCGSDVRVNAILIDGECTEQRTSFDCIDVFGERLAAEKYITIQASNTGRFRQGVTVKIYGTKVKEGEAVHVAE